MICDDCEKQFDCYEPCKESTKWIPLENEDLERKKMYNKDSGRSVNNWIQQFKCKHGIESEI